MSDLTEILATYLFFLLSWPTAFVNWALIGGAWQPLLLWLGLGIPVILLLYRFRKRHFLMAWIVVWFMPSTIICGSATSFPWAFALYAFFQGGACSSVLSLSISLAINAAIVIASAALIRKLRRVPSKA